QACTTSTATTGMSTRYAQHRTETIADLTANSGKVSPTIWSITKTRPEATPSISKRSSSALVDQPPSSQAKRSTQLQASRLSTQQTQTLLLAHTHCACISRPTTTSL